MSLGHASITTIYIKADGSMQVIAAGDVGHIPPNLQSGTSADRGDPPLSQRGVAPASAK
jgi:serine/threonine-protein phosphatase PGAM5